MDLDKNIDINDVTPNCRVALRNDSYTLHKILPNKVRDLRYDMSHLMGKPKCGFRPGLTQTGLYKGRKELEA